ncbi:dynein axonemal intermediate chain 1-like isoform X2 [Panulirus ornatus]|uniref:dynein axonemal intermediate chain 1-like isoform X2 n=1 Tax=Panulirus ornatus TaxID=150431 RepID=UPI003A8A19DB
MGRPQVARNEAQAVGPETSSPRGAGVPAGGSGPTSARAQRAVGASSSAASPKRMGLRTMGHGNTFGEDSPRGRWSSGDSKGKLSKLQRMRLLLRMRAALGKTPSQAGMSVEGVAEASARDTTGRGAGVIRVETHPLPNAANHPRKGVREPDVVIRLSSAALQKQDEVRYNFTTGLYETVRDDDPLLHLLTLPSRIIHKSERPTKPLQLPLLSPPSPSPPPSPDTPDSEPDECSQVSRAEIDVMCDGMVSEEELARIDAQPNPFNFSERVSQTTRLGERDLAIQTEPPPSTTFSVNVGLCNIYHAYKEDYSKVLEREHEAEREKERERERERGPPKPKQVLDPIVLPPPQLQEKFGVAALNLPGLSLSARVVERMVSQNIYDDISQDFRYWEDGSDEFRPLEGSLLPLWKFHHDKSRSLIVADVCWSPIYPDLFAAAYSAGDIGGAEGPGMLCLYTLKNPATPERVFHTPCGVLCLHFHPQHGSMVVAGWSDGTVVMYDVRSSTSPTIILPITTTGKHLLPVTQVRWIRTEPGEDLSFFSVALDGRLTQWYVHASTLYHTDILNFNIVDQLTTNLPAHDKVHLEGVATCIAFKPDDETVLLLGVDTGVVFQCSTTSTTHSLVRYPAHTSPVRRVTWNTHYHKIFLSCSIDWTIKIWLLHRLSPLIVLDLGGAVAGVMWSPYSSSVFVAVTDEGRVYVYDLFLRKCRPLCVQSLVQRRRVAAACVAFNPFHPIILVGGERGHLVALKLSPNLRKPHKDAKGADAQQLQEIELCKMERLIATTNKG